MRYSTFAATRRARAAATWSALVLLALAIVGCDTQSVATGVTSASVASPALGNTVIADIAVDTPARAVGSTQQTGRLVGYSPICTAQPMPWTLSTLTQEPGVLQGACKLQSVHTDSNNDGVIDGALQYTHGLHKLTIQHKAGEQIFFRDKEGRVIKRVITSTNSGYVHADTREFDDNGHLVMNEIRGSNTQTGADGQTTVGNLYIHRITQVWDGDLLLQRREWQNKTGPTKRTTWRYDSAGRMLEATRRIGSSDTVAGRAMWTYDAVGRPTRLVREIGGKLAMSATWEWGVARQLRHRTIQVWLGVGSLSGGSLSGGSVSGGQLDSYDAPTGSNNGACYGCGYGYGYGGSNNGKPAWADALMQAKDGCATLPVAVGHGYPEADYGLIDEDDLAWSKSLGGYSVYGHYGSYYGNGSGYGYGYGGGAKTFVGHGGLGVNWDALAVAAPHTSARFEIHYDAKGRMTTEALQVTQSKPMPELPTKLLRRRIFGAQGLISDAVLHPSAAATSTALRTLSFTRDTTGRLASRSLSVAGQLAELDTWKRDGSGRPVEQQRFSQKQPWKTLSPTAKPLPMPSPILTSRVLQSRDHAGRPLQVRALLAHSPSNEMLETMAYDTGGRLIAHSRGTTDKGMQIHQQWAFDAEGRQTMHAWQYPQSSLSSDRFESTTYNSAGLKIVGEHGKHLQDGPTWRQVRTYDCK